MYVFKKEAVFLFWGSHMAVLRRPNGVPEIKPGSATFRTSVLPNILFPWS